MSITLPYVNETMKNNSILIYKCGSRSAEHLFTLFLKLSFDDTKSRLLWFRKQKYKIGIMSALNMKHTHVTLKTDVNIRPRLFHLHIS